jgi:hypothetical protein
MGIPKSDASCLLLVSPDKLVNHIRLWVPVHPDVLIPVHGNKLPLILGERMRGDDRNMSNEEIGIGVQRRVTSERHGIRTWFGGLR